MTLRQRRSRLSGWIVSAVLAATAGPHLRGQTVVVGQLLSQAVTAVTLPSGGLTLVDLAAPATAAGQVTSVTVQWVGGGIAPCSPGLKVKFFRPSSSGASLSYLGERGPFPAVRGLLVLPISPPVALQARDLIGVTEFGGPSCGGIGNTNSGTGIATAQFAGDVTSDKSLMDAFGLRPNQISIQATAGSGEVRTGVIPVVLSASGNFGSRFKTEIQIANPTPYVLAGRLVFHPQGSSATAQDPSLEYELLGGRTVSYPDILAAMAQTGVGSLDVISRSSPSPLFVTRVFNDGGAAGTSGFTEGTIAPRDALQQFESARLLTPPDPVNFRLNVGVRTLSAGASLSVALYGASGTLLSSLVKNYPADYFEQIPVAAFLGGLPPGPNQTIVISVNTGSAIVYGATADNRTNDPSIQFGSKSDF